MGRHDFALPDEAGGTVDLAAVIGDDALLDALGRHRRAAQSSPGSTPVAASLAGGKIDGPRPTPLSPHPAEPELTDLFATWRAAIDADPVPEPPSVDSVVLALRQQSRRRSLRPMLGVAVAICALLVGSTAIGSRTARPGDMLWPVTQVLWSDRADSVVAGDTTRVALGQARMALDAGLTGEARSALVVASTVLPRVAERDGHQNLKADLDNLWSTLDWVQHQHEVAVTAPAPAVPSPTWAPSAEASVGTTATSSPAAGVSASSSPPATDSGATSSRPPASSTGTSTEPSTVLPPTSAPLPPAPPSSAPPPVTSPALTTAPTAPTVPTVPTVPTGGTLPSTATSPTPSTPSSPAPSTDTPTGPSTPSNSPAPSTMPSATQEVLPIAPTTSASGSTVAQIGEQSFDPAQKVQQAVEPSTVASTG
jgi:hypothetical protein